MKIPPPFFLLCIAALAQTLLADVIPNTLFSDNAVLQQQRPVPVWGTAADGEKVTVEFAGQKVETVATNGNWSVTLQPLTATASPQTMSIRGSNTVTLTNLLIGEVWICSGQSNMERQLGLRDGQKPIVNWEAEAASANYPEIRSFHVKPAISANPIASPTGSWAVCSPTTVTNFTAVGYYFGRDLYKNLKVPIGLIHSTLGGTPAEAWTRNEVLATNPVLAPMLDKQAKAIASYPERLAKYQAEEPKLKAAYTNACAIALAAAKPSPRPPSPPQDPLTDSHAPSVLYNGMINPLLPYAMRGVIWYQGEANGGRAKEYQTLFPAMIADWRTQWEQGDFLFLFVQLAPFFKMGPEIREAQFLTLKKTTNTAMTVITDHGDAQDIHPTEKEPVGARLALAARALAYGQTIEYSGPLYESARVDGSSMILSFTHVGKGLVAKDGSLKGFTVAGADKVFIPADAVIKESSVVVSNPQVTSPVAVRYGWTNAPDVNLFNAEGLPASPFRTDTE